MKHCAGYIDQAYTRFAHKYPHWAAGIMSQAFLEQRVKPTIQLAWAQGRQPGPLDIALLWPPELNAGSLEERRAQLEEAAAATLAFISELRHNSSPNC